MGQFQPKVFEQILRRMINRVVSRSDLNDLNDGSDIKQVLAAAAREDDDAHFQMVQLLDLFDIFKATGADLDERAKEFNPRLVSRLQPAAATGEVRFSRAGTAGVVTIPIGTQVTVPAVGDQAELVFTTTEEGTIPNLSQDSNLVDVQAEAAGVTGNISPGAIQGFVSKPAGVDTVTSLSAFTNGADLESDDDFRRRLVNQIKGLARAHVDGLETAALAGADSLTGKQVKFAQVVEDPINLGRVTVYIDDGAGTAEAIVVHTGVVVLASAIGGETVLFTPHKPLKRESAVLVVRRNTIAMVEGVDYSINPASGQINFLPGSFPTGLTLFDVIDADYTEFIGLIQIVQKIIDGDAADRVNFPGYRAAGVLVRVLSPNIIQQLVQANITVVQGFNQVDVADKVKAAISGYINGLGISGDVILNELKERAMGVPGMYDVSFTLPVGNTVILDNQLARIISTNLTVT